MTTERMEVQRAIAADPAAIFRGLCDPQGHLAIDSSGMLMAATGEPVQAAGDEFVVHMDREALGDYPLGLYDEHGPSEVRRVTAPSASPESAVRTTPARSTGRQLAHVVGSQPCWGRSSTRAAATRASRTG